MVGQERIKSLLKEAFVYKNQGLFRQAKDKFNHALEFLYQNQTPQSNSELIAAIEEKLRELDATIKEVDNEKETPRLSGDVQSLIKKSFTFSKDREAAAIEGAMALAKFGQLDKALEEFKEILEYATLPVMIAKNIIRCLINMSSPEEALHQFKTWAGGSRFSKNEILHLGEFLRGILESRGISLKIPIVSEPTAGTQGKTPHEEDKLDISSVSIHLESIPQKEHRFEFPVHFQSGNTISVVVPASSSELVQTLERGTKLTSIQCFSSIGLYPGRGTVTGKTKVLQGPDTGNFMVDIKLDD